MNIHDTDIKKLIDYYWNNISSVTHIGTMNKIKVCDYWNNGLGNILEKYLPKKPIGDNFYRHNNPYLPHADNRQGVETYNYVIPLETAHDQKFIVFDQKVKMTGRTWVGNLEFDFSCLEPNTYVRERFYECDFVSGLTTLPLEDRLYENIPYFNKDYYFGMSGTIYDWIPGKIIVFNSRQIHMTGYMKDGFKLGLSLRIPI